MMILIQQLCELTITYMYKVIVETVGNMMNPLNTDSVVIQLKTHDNVQYLMT